MPGEPAAKPGRRRGRHSAVALNFLAAVGNVNASSSHQQATRNGNNHQRNEPSPRTPKKSPQSSYNAATTPATVSSSSPNVYSPSLFGGAQTRRSSSTRSQQSGKTEPTLDTLESSLGRESSASLRQPQPLQRTANLQQQQQRQQYQQPGMYHQKPTTIYEQHPDVMTTPARSQQQQQQLFYGSQHPQQQQQPRQPQHYQQQQQAPIMVESSPGTPGDASHFVYSPPIFPATSPRTARLVAGEYSDHSSLTTSTSRPPGTPNTTGATMDEIRPTESYFMPSPPVVAHRVSQSDPEQRTTTSSLSTHSTPQKLQRVGHSLDAHVQQKAAYRNRQVTEDWESVSTNEVGLYGHRVNVHNVPSGDPQTLGQSIDQGLDLLLGSGWVQCAAPTTAVRGVEEDDSRHISTSASSSPSRTGSHSSRSTRSSRGVGRRTLEAAPSSVSGASTEIATNRAVDLALKRVQEIEKSRGTEQALYEARQALVRLKDTPQYFRPSPPPPDFTVQIAEDRPFDPNNISGISNSPSVGRLSFGTSDIAAPRCEVKSILSDSTEEGSGEHPHHVSSSASAGRLDRKVHRMAQHQQLQYPEDGEASLPNESLPSSIGVEVDSRGVAKSNPALRAVFEQHTLESLRRERGIETRQPSSYSQKQNDKSYLDPALAAVYHPPPPPPLRNPPEPMRVTHNSHNEVRKYNMKTGRGTVVRRASPPTMAQQHQLTQQPRQSYNPDPIVCHGPHVPYDGNDGGNDGGASVVPTVVLPPNVMMSLSHDSSLSGGNLFESLSPGERVRKSIHTSESVGVVSPLTTHTTGEVELPTKNQKPRLVSRFARASRLAKRWPPVSTASPGLTGQSKAKGNSSSEKDIKPSGAKEEMNNSGDDTSNLHSSPAWSTKQRMQQVQQQSKEKSQDPPASDGNRVSEIRRQLFTKKPTKSELDSFVIRRNSQETLGEPAIDDTSIDLQSVKSAFESIHKSFDQASADAEGEDTDDDTASVKSLKEKFEGSTGSLQKKESEVSKVRAMFESKTKSPAKPFESGPSELQAVFAKFQRNTKVLPKPKTTSRNSSDTPRSSPEAAENLNAAKEVKAISGVSKEGNQQDNKGGPDLPKTKGVSVADRVKAFGANRSNSQSDRPPPFKPSKITPKGGDQKEVRPRSSAHTILEARQSLRSSPQGSLVRPQLKRNDFSNSAESPGERDHVFPRSSPTSVQAAAKTWRPSPKTVNEVFATEVEIRREHGTPNLGDAPDGEARKLWQPVEDTTTAETQHAQSGRQPNETPASHASVGNQRTVLIIPEQAKTQSSHVNMIPDKQSPRAKSNISAQGTLRASSPVNSGTKLKPRASPTTIEEARRALRSSPVSQRESDGADDGQIEHEIAAITGADRSHMKGTPDSHVRKFDWFQRAAVEVGGMSQGEDTASDLRPVTPRVQERVRLFSTANAAISGVRRPVPTPANFNSELREIAKQRPMTPERQRLSFRGWAGDDTKVADEIGPGVIHNQARTQISGTRNAPFDVLAPVPASHPMDTDVEKWLRPKPRRFEPTASLSTPRVFVRDYAPQQKSQGIVPRDSAGQQRNPSHVEPPTLPTEAPLVKQQEMSDGAIEDTNVQNAAAALQTGSPNASTENINRTPSGSGSEFSDGVTLDMSIAEVSGLTLPTALVSRAGGERSVTTVEEEVEQDSENSSKNNAEVEAKRSEASSSQTSEALIPLLNKTLRQRPMSDERSMGDSFFEARAIVANHWSKTSEIGQQRNVPRESFKKAAESKDDSSGFWDPARIEKSFPVTPSNAGDIFDFESGWEEFSAEQRRADDPFKPNDEKKSDDPASRSTTPTRSNRYKPSGSYIDRRYPEYPLSEGRTAQSSPRVFESSYSGREPRAQFEPPLRASSFDDAHGGPPEAPTISSFESIERLSRSHLARHASSAVENSEFARPPEMHSLHDPPQIMNTHRADGARPSTFFGRTHPRVSDPTWDKGSYPAYDPIVPREALPQQAPPAPSWRPPAGTTSRTNPVSEAMQRYGAQHAALLARLKALKEARVRRANAIYARTTSVFPRQVEIDDYSLSTKSSTQFGGSHFMESLKVD